MADEQKKIILSVGLDTSQASAGVNELKSDLNNLNNTDLAKPFKSFKAEIKEATNEAKKMSEQYGEFSQQANAANKKVAELRDSQSELNERISSFNPDNKFQSLVSIAKGATGAIQGIAGGLTLVGVNSATAEESIAKLQALMALSDSLNSIDDLKNGYKQFTNIARQAFSSVKAGIASTGIGLLVIAVGLLVANFDAVKKAVLNFIPGLAKLGEWFGKLYDSVTDFIGVTSDATRAQEAFAKATEASIKRSQEFLDTESDKYDKYTVAKVKAKQDYNKKLLELDKDESLSESEKNRLKVAYAEKANRELNQADKDRSAEVQKGRDEELTKQKAFNDKKNEAAKTAKAELDSVQYGDKLKALNPVERAIFELEEKNKKEQAILKKNHADTILNELNFRNELSAIIAGSLDKEVIKATAVTGAKIQLDTDLKSKLIASQDEGVRVHNASQDAQLEWEAITTEQKTKLASDALGQVSDLLGKQTVAGKAFAIAQTTIDTYQSATSSYKSLAGIPYVGPALGAIAAAAAVAAGIANVKRILAVKVPASAGGSSAGSGGISAPSVGSAPVINAQSTNQQQVQDVRVTNNNQPQLVEAYISDSSLKSNEQKTNFLNNISRF